MIEEECGYEFGGCVGCQVEDPNRLGDKNCDDAYNTEACGYYNGDCVEVFVLKICPCVCDENLFYHKKADKYN